ncbi:MAG: N-acetyltransferase family protein [Methanomicrobiales archaeon]
MPEEFALTPIASSDREAVIDLFNYYIEHSFAAYPTERVPYEFFRMVEEVMKGFPTVAARDRKGTLIGFAFLHPHNPMPTFAHTAEVTYFVKPECTGKGIGSRMLAFLEEGGRKRGISCLLASISSLNEGSIRFHTRHGFVECGRFREIGRKKGRYFDTVWMEKRI